MSRFFAAVGKKRWKTTWSVFTTRNHPQCRGRYCREPPVEVDGAGWSGGLMRGVMFVVLWLAGGIAAAAAEPCLVTLTHWHEPYARDQPE